MQYAIKKLEKIKRLFADGNLLASIKKLLEICEELIIDYPGNEHLKFLFNEILTLKARYEILHKEKNNGTLVNEFFFIEKNKLLESQLACTGQLEEIIRELYRADSIASVSNGATLTRVRKSEIEIKIQGDIDSFSDEVQKELLKSIGILLNLKETDVVIKKIKSGSVLITLEIPNGKVEELYRLIKSGALRKYNVIDAQIKEELEERNDVSQISSEQLEKHYSSSLLLYSRWLVGDEENYQAEDLVSTVFFKLANRGKNWREIVESLNKKYKENGLKSLYKELNAQYFGDLQKKEKFDSLFSFIKRVSQEQKDLISRMTYEEFLEEIKDFFNPVELLVIELKIHEFSNKDISKILNMRDVYVQKLVVKIRNVFAGISFGK